MGIIRSILKLGLISSLMYVSYYAGFTGVGKEYGMKIINNQYYVVNHRMGLSEPLNNSFQMGSIEYRIKGLLNEDPKKLKSTIDKLIEGYSKNK